MPIPVQLYNSLVPVQLCRTTTTTRVLYRSTTTVPVRILLGKLYSVQPYSRTRTLTLRRSQKVTKTTVFVCWNIFFKKSSWDRFAARTRLERHTCTQLAERSWIFGGSVSCLRKDFQKAWNGYFGNIESIFSKNMKLQVGSMGSISPQKALNGVWNFESLKLCNQQTKKPRNFFFSSKGIPPRQCWARTRYHLTCSHHYAKGRTSGKACSAYMLEVVVLSV